MERTNCLGNEEGDNNNSLSSGFLWPQRNYTCSFCKRQFNSAQALGGHMNVHRRDRAMLIQLPSWVFDCPNPNPNPNSNFPYSSTSLSSSSSSPYSPNNKMLPVNYPYNYSPPSYHENKKSNLESPLSQDFAKKKMKKSMRSNVLEVEEFNSIKGFSQKYELEVLKKKNEVISLDLEIGCKDPKEVLDLELRLGCF